MLRYGSLIHGRFVLSDRFRIRGGLVMHHLLRPGCRFVVNHDMLRCRFVVVHHYRWRRVMVVVHHYRLRMHYGMVSQVVGIVAEFKRKVVAAAEAYHYHTGHHEHFQKVLVHCYRDRRLCLYMNIAHMKQIFI